MVWTWSRYRPDSCANISRYTWYSNFANVFGSAEIFASAGLILGSRLVAIFQLIRLNTGCVSSTYASSTARVDIPVTYGAGTTPSNAHILGISSLHNNSASRLPCGGYDFMDSVYRTAAADCSSNGIV